MPLAKADGANTVGRVQNPARVLGPIRIGAALPTKHHLRGVLFQPHRIQDIVMLERKVQENVGHFALRSHILENRPRKRGGLFVHLASDQAVPDEILVQLVECGNALDVVLVTKAIDICLGPADTSLAVAASHEAALARLVHVGAAPCDAGPHHTDAGRPRPLQGREARCPREAMRCRADDADRLQTAERSQADRAASVRRERQVDPKGEGLRSAPRGGVPARSVEVQDAQILRRSLDRPVRGGRARDDSMEIPHGVIAGVLASGNGLEDGRHSGSGVALRVERLDLYSPIHTGQGNPANALDLLPRQLPAAVEVSVD
mmetsp:Transcript_5800/g.16371  ORF Transcript_5800/g.16371 Transcript_5800/m.16371 type:complete len:318 (-) Transcript_5800:154-1107(-)